MKTIQLVPILSALLLCTAAADPATETTTPANNTENARATQATGSLDGFTMRGDEALMTRNGVTTVLEREAILPNGIRVHRNGDIVLRDGTRAKLQPNQRLTFDGKLEEITSIAFTGTVTSPANAAAPSNSKSVVGYSDRDGITVSGTDVFITRNGVTEQMTKEVHLPNGVLAKTDGTIVLGDGKTITLRPDQVLDLNGVLREAPVQLSQPGVTPSTNPAK